MARAVPKGSIEEAVRALEAAANTAHEKAAVRAVRGVFDVKEGQQEAKPEPATPGQKAAAAAGGLTGDEVRQASRARGEAQPGGQGRATAQPVGVSK